MKNIKFNWIDALIIVLILAIGAGGYAFLQKRKGASGVAAQSMPLWFQIETVKNHREIAEQFTVGTNVVFGEKKVDRGVITAVEIVPFEEEVEDKIRGTWRMEPIAGLWNAIVTVEFDGYDSDTAFTGSQEQVMVGKSTVIEGKGVASEGYIVGVGLVDPTRSGPADVAGELGGE